MALIIVQETFGMCKRCGEFANACAHNIYGLHSRDTNKSIFDPHIRNQTCMEHTTSSHTHTRTAHINDRTTSNEQRAKKMGRYCCRHTNRTPATHELFHLGYMVGCISQRKQCGRVSSFHFIFDLTNNFIYYLEIYHMKRYMYSMFAYTESLSVRASVCG